LNTNKQAIINPTQNSVLQVQHEANLGSQ